MPPLQGDGKKQAKKPLSSPIQTILSVLELHQFNLKRFADFTADQGISPCPEVLTQLHY